MGLQDCRMWFMVGEAGDSGLLLTTGWWRGGWFLDCDVITGDGDARLLVLGDGVSVMGEKAG